MKESQKFRFKVIVIGDGTVGKTSLIKKFTKGSFQKEYIKTLGAQFSILFIEKVSQQLLCIVSKKIM